MDVAPLREFEHLIQLTDSPRLLEEPVELLVTHVSWHVAGIMLFVYSDVDRRSVSCCDVW